MRKEDRPPTLQYQGPYRAGADLESPIKSPAKTPGDYSRARHLSVTPPVHEEEDDAAGGSRGGGLPTPSPAVSSARRRVAARRRRRWSCWCGCCCALASLLLLLLAALGVVELCLYLILKPKAPSFQLEDLSITSFGLSEGPPGAARLPPAALLNLDLSYRVLAGNPNKVPIRYRPTNLTLLYGGQAIGKAQIPAFVESSHSLQNLTGSIHLHDMAVGAAGSAQLTMDFLAGTVPLQVDGVVAASVNILGLHTPELTVYVHCNVSINVATRALASKDCRVHL